MNIYDRQLYLINIKLSKSDNIIEGRIENYNSKVNKIFDTIESDFLAMQFIRNFTEYSIDPFGLNINITYALIVVYNSNKRMNKSITNLVMLNKHTNIQRYNFLMSNTLSSKVSKLKYKDKENLDYTTIEIIRRAKIYYGQLHIVKNKDIQELNKLYQSVCEVLPEKLAPNIDEFVVTVNRICNKILEQEIDEKEIHRVINSIYYKKSDNIYNSIYESLGKDEACKKFLNLYKKIQFMRGATKKFTTDSLIDNVTSGVISFCTIFFRSKKLMKILLDLKIKYALDMVQSIQLFCKTPTINNYLNSGQLDKITNCTQELLKTVRKEQLDIIIQKYGFKYIKYYRIPYSELVKLNRQKLADMNYKKRLEVEAYEKQTGKSFDEYYNSSNYEEVILSDAQFHTYSNY